MKDLQDIFITDNNREWIETLKKEDLTSFRRLLKKERETFPTKYRRLYLESDDRLTDLMYTLIFYAPGLTHLKARARTYFRTKDVEPTLSLRACGECYWFTRYPLVEDNEEIQGEDRYKSCQELGAQENDMACKGFYLGGDTHEQERSS